MKVQLNVTQWKWLRRSVPFTQIALSLVSAYVCFFASPSPGQEVLSQPGKVPSQYLSPPEPQRVFRLESEHELMERMAREARQGLTPMGLSYALVLPTYPPVPPQVDSIPRPWEPLAEIIEPAYLCYGRLYFEQINSERYGWDLGPLHPLISAGIFYLDVATLPYHAATDPLRRYECNTGYALPGDPMPLLLYRPNLNLPGALAEAAAVGLMFVIFP
jgi:hypothetical protein